MKFGNVVLLCKNWYQMRDHNNFDTFWMDMAHAIDADGWSCFSKNDVYQWCLHRLDEMKKDEKLYNMSNQLTLSYIFNEVENMIRRALWYDKKDLDYRDALIWVYRSIISNMEKSYFNEELLPNSNVLPFSLHEAWVDDERYSKNPQWHPAQMTCDYLEHVNKIMTNGKAQDIDENRFNQIEASLYKNSYKDVRIPIGEDNLNDCIELKLSASNLKKHNAKIDGKDVWFEIGSFDRCNDLQYPENLNKLYKCRLKKIYDDFFDEYTYELKSVQEI